jgi:hypothetical protein
MSFNLWMLIVMLYVVYARANRGLLWPGILADRPQFSPFFEACVSYLE